MKRWSELPAERRGTADTGDLEVRLGLLFRQAPPPPPLPEASLRRVAARLQSPERSTRRLRLPVIIALILGSSGLVYARREIGAWVAAVGGRLTTPREKMAAPLPVPLPAARGEGTVESRRVPIVAARGEGTVELPRLPIAAPPSKRPRHRRAHATVRRLALAPAVPAAPTAPAPPVAPTPSPSPAPESTPPALPSSWGAPPANYSPPRPAQLGLPPAAVASLRPSALGDEAQLLKRALHSLQRPGGAREALGLLNAHRRRFPRGLLVDDARLLRVDALLALGRGADALALLEMLPLEGVPRGLELRLVRGELRAATSCARAREDFEHVLARSLPAGLAARARRGLAVCGGRRP